MGKLCGETNKPLFHPSIMIGWIISRFTLHKMKKDRVILFIIIHICIYMCKKVSLEKSHCAHPKEYLRCRKITFIHSSSSPPHQLNTNKTRQRKQLLSSSNWLIDLSVFLSPYKMFYDASQWCSIWFIEHSVSECTDVGMWYKHHLWIHMVQKLLAEKAKQKKSSVLFGNLLLESVLYI